MNTLLRNSVFAAGLMAAAGTQAALIDFETDGNGAALNAGDFVTASTYTASGVTFSTDATVQGTSGAAASLMIFDSNSPTGGESDLETAHTTVGTGTNNTVERDNILIISADNNQGIPNANFKGGNIFLDFDEDVDFNEIGLLDVDKVITVTLFDALGTQLAQLSADNSLGNNSYEGLIFNQSGVRSATVALGGDSAITHIDFSAAAAPPPPPPPAPPPPVPVSEPGALALLALGMFGMVASRRRLAKKA